jgi:hypothetical protein
VLTNEELEELTGSSRKEAEGKEETEAELATWTLSKWYRHWRTTLWHLIVTWNAAFKSLVITKGSAAILHELKRDNYILLYYINIMPFKRFLPGQSGW